MTAVSRADTEQRGSGQVRAWDLPTRLFHWTLVALIASAYVTRTYLSDPTLYLHRLNGYAILTLLIFRLLWGVVGSSTSRFAAFFPLPGAAIRYLSALLRRKPLHYLGHNPVGSALIFAMLLAVAAQACTGLFTSDDAIAQGPMTRHVSDDVIARASSYHAKGFWIILTLVAIHVTANLVYQFALKDRLITSMVTGRKAAGDYVDQQQARLAPGLLALLCLLIAGLLVAGGVVLAGDSLLR